MPTKEEQERLLELRAQFEEKNERAMRLEHEIKIAKRAEKSAKIVSDGVNEAREGTIMYRPIGKLFIQTPSDELKASLSQSISDREALVQRLSSQLSEAQTELEAAKVAFREEVQRIAARQ